MIKVRVHTIHEKTSGEFLLPAIPRIGERFYCVTSYEVVDVVHKANVETKKIEYIEVYCK